MDTRPCIRLARRIIGPGNPVYVIAEAGVNHNGDPREAFRLIDAAREAGADAVKFQYFSADQLVAANAPTCQYQQMSIGAVDQRQMLRRLELPIERFAELKIHADRIGVDFLVTPFGVSQLLELVDLGVSALKIASPDLVNVPLLTAAAQSGAPIILSTGASDLHEVDAAVHLLRGRRAADRFALLHCVSAYPTHPADARLRCIRTLADRFNVPVGFSDHTADPTFSLLAVSAGAVILEKHLTLDRSALGPDHFFSLTPRDFARYVAAARQAHAALGDGVIECSDAEREVRRLARGSIVSTMHIRPGTRLTADMVTVRRPGGGIDPLEWDRILRSVARTDILADTPLSWQMLDSRIDKPISAAAIVD